MDVNQGEGDDESGLGSETPTDVDSGARDLDSGAADIDSGAADFATRAEDTDPESSGAGRTTATRKRPLVIGAVTVVVVAAAVAVGVIATSSGPSVPGAGVAASRLRRLVDADHTGPAQRAT